MSKRAKRTFEPEDDGKTIVNMNVEGMPWYVRGKEERSDRPDSGEHYRMTREEERAYKWAAVKAGLLVVLIFALVFGLFLAFCDFVWFR